MTACIFTILLSALTLAYAGPVTHIHITNYGPGTSLFYGAMVTDVANDHSLARFEVRKADFSWFECKDVGNHNFKCLVDTEIVLPLSIRLEANGETITGYNKIMSFDDGETYDFGSNFQSDNMQIQTGEQGNPWHYSARINGMTLGYTVSLFEVRKDDGEWFVCHDVGYEFVCNVDTMLTMPISVRVTGHNPVTDMDIALTSDDLITNFTDNFAYDFGANFAAIDWTVTSSTTTSSTSTSTTAAPSNGSKKADNTGVIVGFVFAIIVSLVIGIAIGMFVYRRQQQRKGYQSNALEMKESHAIAKEEETMAKTDAKHSFEEHGVNVVEDDANEDDEDAEDKGIVGP